MSRTHAQNLADFAQTWNFQFSIFWPFGIFLPLWNGLLVCSCAISLAIVLTWIFDNAKKTWVRMSGHQWSLQGTPKRWPMISVIYQQWLISSNSPSVASTPSDFPSVASLPSDSFLPQVCTENFQKRCQISFKDQAFNETVIFVLYI